jgi:hypothetical protein
LQQGYAAELRIRRSSSNWRITRVELALDVRREANLPAQGWPSLAWPLFISGRCSARRLIYSRATTPSEPTCLLVWRDVQDMRL